MRTTKTKRNNKTERKKKSKKKKKTGPQLSHSALQASFLCVVRCVCVCVEVCVCVFKNCFTEHLSMTVSKIDDDG